MVEGVTGNSKSIVQRKTMSKGTDHIIIKNAKLFAEADTHLVSTTYVIYIPQSKIDEEIIVRNPLKRTIPINRIFTTHVIKCLHRMVKLRKHLQYVNHQLDISINFTDYFDSSSMQQYDNTERQYEVAVGDWGGWDS